MVITEFYVTFLAYFIWDYIDYANIKIKTKFLKMSFLYKITIKNYKQYIVLLM